jgi:hypothetical protein
VKSTAKTDIVTYQFQSSDAAWSFMRACDAAKFQAGYPSLDEQPTVQVAIPSWVAREELDKLARGATVVGYAFTGEAACGELAVRRTGDGSPIAFICERERHHEGDHGLGYVFKGEAA